MQKENILGTAPVGKLLRKFAVPSIVSMLVISLYNIVDQFFIGQTVGHLGNAATNVAFPITTLCLAVTLAFGIGGASGFNLNLGAGDKKQAMKFIGNSVTMLVVIGIVIAILAQIFLSPVLVLCGASKNVLPYGIEYMRIILIGVPFVVKFSRQTVLTAKVLKPPSRHHINQNGLYVSVGRKPRFER